MSKFKILLAAALLLLVATLVLAVGNVTAGEPGGSGHGIIRALL